MQSTEHSTTCAAVQKPRHPALSFEALSRVRTAPRARHVELEALELSRVVLEARAELERSSSWDTLEALGELEHHERLAVALYAAGQALRVPVCVRAGMDDKHGADAPGNGLGRLLAALKGRSRPFSGETARRVCAAGHESETIARASRMQLGAWCDAAGRSWRRKFLRGLVYVPAERLRELYLGQAWPELVAAIGRVLPSAWRRAAFLRRDPLGRGYWGKIAPPATRPAPRTVVPDRTIAQALRAGASFVDIARAHGGIPFARIRAVWSRIKESWGIKSSKRVQTTEGRSSAPSGASKPSPAKGPERLPTRPESARAAPQRAGQGGGCPTPVLESDASRSDTSRPASFLARMMLELGSDHPLMRGGGR